MVECPTMSHFLLRFKLPGAFVGGAVSCYLGQEVAKGRSLDDMRCSLDKITRHLRKGLKIEKKKVWYLYLHCWKKTKQKIVKIR